MLDAFNSAKCIITFNGSMFDIPFLKKAFPQIKFPKCHIDLRFFAKREGYRGGQKLIEQQLGFQRPKRLKEINGYEATILWHKYKEGDIEAIKKLIEYNCADIDGMKFLFEKLTEKALERRGLINDFSYAFEFSNYLSRYRFANHAFNKPISVKPFINESKPAFTIDNLMYDGNRRVVGIDLTGSEKRASGWCLLDGAQATTMVLHSDEELIRKTVECNPAVISIDSPLSLPEGRMSVYDTDPGRNQFGITRECERIMAKRGVKSYPCLIQSMQKLTERGMMLALRFRELGHVVIESYPGAAQDILGIPRKGKSLEFLVKGLKNFGILGSFDQAGVTHDEIDAITSAIVGHFYLANQFEALGNNREGYLIIPKINSHS
jgi:predicted nuclease with RNAse H fold